MWVLRPLPHTTRADHRKRWSAATLYDGVHANLAPGFVGGRSIVGAVGAVSRTWRERGWGNRRIAGGVRTG